MTGCTSAPQGQTQSAASSLVLRQAVAQDELCISALGMQVFLDTYATEGIRESIAQAAFDLFTPTAVSALMADPAITVFVALVDQHLAGFAQVALNEDHELIGCSAAAELQRLYIQEKFTGRGIGRQLLLRAEDHARQHAASRLWATVWARNERALGFYSRQGYEHLGTPLYRLQNETHSNCLFAKTLQARTA